MRLIGATICEWAPIDVVHVPLRPGLTLLYGKNGSGKTRVLEALRWATGSSLTEDREQDVFFDNTSVYLHFELDPDEPDNSLEHDRVRRTGNVDDYRPHRLNHRVMRAWSEQQPWQAIDGFQPSDAAVRQLAHEVQLGRYVSVKLGFGVRALEVWASIKPQESPAFTTVVERQRRVSDLMVPGSWHYIDEMLWASSDPEDGPHAEHAEHPELQEALTSWSRAGGGHVRIPSAFLTPNRPAWTPVPLFKLDDLRSLPLRSFSEHTDRDLIAESLEVILGKKTIDGLHSRMFSPGRTKSQKGLYEGFLETDRATLNLNSGFFEAAAQLSKSANEFLRQMLEDPPAVILDVRRPVEWLVGPPIEWMAMDPVSGRKVALDALSSSQRRWVKLACQWAISEHQQGESTRVVILDEPETALHPTAVLRLGIGLQALATQYGAYVVAATHAPGLINTPNSTLLHVQRTRSGITIEPPSWVSEPGGVADTARNLGLTPADLILMTRAFLIVEGEAEMLTFRRLFGPEFDRHHITVLPMRGTFHMLSILSAHWIFTATTAPVVIVVDNLRQHLLDHLQQAQEDAKTAPGDAVARSLLAKKKSVTKSYEEEKVLDLMVNALTRHQAGRLSFVGLSQPDLIYYTTPSHFVSGVETWEELEEIRPRGEGHPADIKAWLSHVHHADVGPAAIAQAVDQDRIHPDLQAMYDHVITLAGPFESLPS